MANDLLDRISLDLLHPVMAEKAHLLAAACRARGADYFAVSGYRSAYPEQFDLWCQGRTVGGKAYPGPVVTSARPFQSTHNYGLAVDFTRDKDTTRKGLQPTWDRAAYLPLGEEALKLNLDAGVFWKMVDGPHVQLPLDKKGLTVAVLERAFRRGGMPAVWALVDERGPW